MNKHSRVKKYRQLTKWRTQNRSLANETSRFTDSTLPIEREVIVTDQMEYMVASLISTDICNKKNI